MPCAQEGIIDREICDEWLAMSNAPESRGFRWLPCVYSLASSPGKYSILESFPLAKFAAKLLTARKIATYAAILESHPAIRAAKGILPQAAR